MEVLKKSAFQFAAQQIDILGEGCVDLAQLLDLAHGMHHGGMVAAAALAAACGQGPRGEPLGEIHRTLARTGHGARPALFWTVGTAAREHPREPPSRISDRHFTTHGTDTRRTK